VNASIPSKIRPTISLYQLRDSAVVPTEFASRCGGRVCIYSQGSCYSTNTMADMKMRMCLIGGIIILLIVIIVPAGMYSNLQDNNATNHSIVVVATHK
jgi:hypothetical protein